MTHIDIYNAQDFIFSLLLFVSTISFPFISASNFHTLSIMIFLRKDPFHSVAWYVLVFFQISLEFCLTAPLLIVLMILIIKFLWRWLPSLAPKDTMVCASAEIPL